MAKTGNETKAIVKLISKLSRERLNRELEKSLEEQNKFSEFISTHDKYEYFRGKVEGLRYGIECINKVISEAEI
jgi:hypothetical protein